MTLELDRDFDAFYTATYRRMVGQVYAMTGNMAESEDSVQEAYARAWQRWDKIRTHEHPEAWIRTVAFRLSVSSWRKSVNRLSAHRREHVDTHVPGMTPDHLALVSALRRISADQRQALVLFHIAGLSVEEIAEQTDTRVNTVKGRLARGRRALAPYVSEFADAEGESGPGRGSGTGPGGPAATGRASARSGSRTESRKHTAEDGHTARGALAGKLAGKEL